jgi:thiol-disulfide isomerase/thioredoxin
MMNRREFLGVALGTLAVTAGNAGVAAASERVDWSDVTLLDGSILRADTLRGRPVVVEFWASYCPFCRRQNPVLQSLYEAQRGRGLEVLTFSVDSDPAKARTYMAEHGYSFPAAMAGAASKRWFGPQKGLPELFVVDGDGRIVFHETGEMFPEDILELARFARR